MPTALQKSILPVWFRSVLIAAATLMLCSCRAPVVVPSESSPQRTGSQQAQSRSETAEVAEADASSIRLASHEAPAPPPPPETPWEPVEPLRANDVPANEALANEALANVAPAEMASAEPEYPAIPPIPAPPRVALSCPPGGCQVGGPVGAACDCAGCAARGPLDEYLCDGGDCGLPVGVRHDWSIDGLEQEDTVAHYDTLDGRVLVAPSNRVCVYAPRFGAVRRVVNLMENRQLDLIKVLEDDAALALAAREDIPTNALQQLPPVIKIGEDPASLLINRQQAGELEGRIVVREMSDLIKPYCNLQIVKVGIHDNAEKPWLAKAIVSALTWTGDQAPQVTIEAKAASVLVGSVAPGVVYADQGGKPCLRLIKLASTDNARPGEEVSFTLRFDNVGSQEIGNVTIVDNLATRLAYVPDSAEASVEADFSTSENGAGSLVLRWEIKDPLKPGEGGLLQFRVKVR